MWCKTRRSWRNTSKVEIVEDKNEECSDDNCEDLKKTVEVESDVKLEDDKTVEEIKYEDE